MQSPSAAAVLMKTEMSRKWSMLSPSAEADLMETEKSRNGPCYHHLLRQSSWRQKRAEMVHAITIHVHPLLYVVMHVNEGLMPCVCVQNTSTTCTHVLCLHKCALLLCVTSCTKSELHSSDRIGQQGEKDQRLSSNSGPTLYRGVSVTRAIDPSQDPPSLIALKAVISCVISCNNNCNKLCNKLQ